MSKKFLITVIIIFVAFAGFQQFMIESYDALTQDLLDLADRLLVALLGDMK